MWTQPMPARNEAVIAVKRGERDPGGHAVEQRVGTDEASWWAPPSRGSR